MRFKIKQNKSVLKYICKNGLFQVDLTKETRKTIYIWRQSGEENYKMREKKLYKLHIAT